MTFFIKNYYCYLIPKRFKKYMVAVNNGYFQCTNVLLICPISGNIRSEKWVGPNLCLPEYYLYQPKMVGDLYFWF